MSVIGAGLDDDAIDVKSNKLYSTMGPARYRFTYSLSAQLTFE